MSGFRTPQPAPFLPAQPYNPAASMGFDPNGPAGAMMPLMTQFLMQFAGPTNFLPHQNPAQAVTDQLAMRQYFNSTQASNAGLSRMGTGRAAAGIAGIMSMFSDEPLTDLNRQQASTIAQFANNPHLKMALGQLVGPENLEAAMFGSRGDPSMLGAAANRIGYYRPDAATGAKRMSGESLEDFSSDLYATLYEPSGNIEEMVADARSEDAGVREAATAKLKKAAKAEHESVVADDELTTRIADMGAEEVNRIYNKYQPGGKATTVEERAKELTKFDRAVQETGVLAENETHVGALQRRAEKAAVESAHGFMAGQTGQVMEHLFQRGMLPQSIGALSAADRVKILAEQDPDKETLSRLARQFGHRDLMENDEAYSAAVNSGNKAKQDEILDSKMPDYERRVSGSLKKIKERQAAGGPVSAEEAEELMSMDGMDSMANNVDATRASSVVKKHTEALAAIRQIFGDNGNPNAPVPALLAALDHLSQGASARMTNSSKVASTLREMRGMAKEMGMGFEQMANMAGAVGAYGDQIGLAGEVKVEAQANAMALVNRMRKDGAFANQGFGALSEPEALQKAAAIATRTEGSAVSKGSAALRRMYAENKEKHENTELGVIARKMEDPNWDGSYEWRGQQKNYYKTAGRDGMQEMSRIAQESGESARDMQIKMEDFDTQQYQNNADGLKAAQSDFVSRVTNRAAGNTIGIGLQGNKESLLNAGTEQAVNAKEAVSERLTEMIINSSNMTEYEGQQLDYLEKNIESEFEKTLRAQGYSEDEAKAEAKRIMDSTFGTDPKERRTNISRAMSETNIAIEDASNGEFRSARQARPFLQATGNLADERRQQARAAEQAERAGEFYRGTPMMRGSDYMAEIGMTGEGFNFDKFLEATFGITPNSELREKMAPELAGAFAEAQKQIADSTVTDKYLHELAAGKAVDLEGKAITGERAKTELRNLATRGMNDDERAKFNEQFKTEVSREQVNERRSKKLEDLSDDEVAELYKKTAGESGGEATTREEQLAGIQQHMADGGVVEGFDDASLLEEGEYTQDQMKLEARQRSGGMARDEGFKDRHEARRKRGRARFTGLFGRTKGEIITGLRAALYDDAQAGGYSISDDTMKQFMNLGLYETGNDEDRAKFEEAVKNSGLTEAQQNEVLKNFSDFRTARDEELGDKLDPATSGDRGVPVGEEKPHPGSPKAGKDLATGKTGDPAKDTAKKKEKTDGPLNRDKAETAKDVATEGTTPAPEPGKPATPDVTPADTAAESKAAAAATAAKDKDIATEGTTPAPEPGKPVMPDVTPAAAAPERPTPAEVAAGAQPATGETPAAAGPEELRVAGLEVLNDKLGQLTDAVKGLENSFKEMMGNKGAVAQTDAASQDKAPADLDSVPVRQIEPVTPAREIRVAQQAPPVRPAGGGAGRDGGGNIKGTLTLIGLQSAVLAARGSPVFTPTGDGPSVVPGPVGGGPYVSSANVAPAAAEA